MRRLFTKAAKEIIPLNCLFELTYACNLGCIHCYIAKKEKRRLLTKEEVFSILEQLKTIGCLFLTLSGGEIFLRKDFFEIAAYARKLDFALSLFTNGSLINKDIARKIKGLSPFRVEISLYGFKETHDRITGVEGSFDRTIGGIRLLRENGVRALVKTVLMRQNSAEVWELHSFIERELKVDIRGYGGSFLISPRDNGSKEPLEYRLTDMQMKNHIAESNRHFNFKRYFTKLKRHVVTDNDSFCGAGRSTCNITPFGEVNPCVQIRIEEDNNLRNKSFIEIWRDNEAFAKIRQLRFRDRKECLGCEDASYCFVFCQGVNLLEKGALTAKISEYCRRAKFMKEFCAQG